MSGIVFNHIAGAITDHSQSAKDTDTYFKFQLYVDDPGHLKPVLILPNEPSKPEERAQDRNTFSAVRGWASITQTLERQLVSYH